MRITNEMIVEAWLDTFTIAGGNLERTVATVRRCLALAAQPDEPKEYDERERRGFQVSVPGELP